MPQTHATRRSRWRVLLLLCAFAALPGCGDSTESFAEPGFEPPNVVLLVMDTTRGDRVSFNGYGRPTTPRLERVAEQSVVFRNAWSPSSWTGPAHASIFTGLRPEHHGFSNAARLYLDEGPPTLAEMLREAGYRTACFSVNTWIAREYGLTRGFETAENLKNVENPDYPTSVWSHRRALGFAKRAMQDGQRFFLFVNDMEPHLTYDPPEEFARRFVKPTVSRERIEEGARFTRERAKLHNVGYEPASTETIDLLSDLYDAEIATLDSAIGALLDGLADAGALQNTLLVVAGDHGENLGDHGLLDHWQSLHRSVLHVPLLVHLPGRLDGGRTVDDLVRLEDIFPTILTLCGVALPEELDGLSLTGDRSGRIARAITGPNSPSIRTGMGLGPALRLYTGSRASVFDGRFHLAVSESTLVELYDVPADPTESRNLAEEMPEVVERLRADLPRFE